MVTKLVFHLGTPPLMTCYIQRVNDDTILYIKTLLIWNGRQQQAVGEKKEKEETVSSTKPFGRPDNNRAGWLAIGKRGVQSDYLLHNTELE